MALPLLTSLELVYIAMGADSDHELISYIVDAFPRLKHLEIHRYRGNWYGLSRYKPMARILSRAQSLRTVRLNLDFRNDPRPYCVDGRLRDRWLQKLREKIGPEIVRIMQTCASLEHVAILYHGSPSSVWVEFHPSRARCVEPRFVMSYSDPYVDSEMLPPRRNLAF
ncbi:hypothetical protein LXA43DRAFT_1093429 [Ganoderma leucocontextum]|nr:hypothetical protein LXA43DRAFT_1093429 [Ganoderma leucocontextum]